MVYEPEMAIARTGPLAGPAPHPGEMLKDELEAHALSAHALSIALHYMHYRIHQTLRATPATAAGVVLEA